jgi:hypothetical protein
MTKLSGRHCLGLALSLVLALSTQKSYAGALEIDLTVGADTIQILQGGFYDVASDPNTITVNTSALNASLAALGHGNLTFSALGAQTNNPGDISGATLTQTGSAAVALGGGTVSFSTVAFQTDYLIPTGATGTLASSAGGTFTKTSAGDSTTFQSFYDPTNTGAETVPSPLLSFISPSLNGNQSYSGSNNTPLGAVTAPYAVVNQINASITSTGTNMGQNQFTGSTVVFATAIPEPASVVMMMSALPIAFGLIRRFRRGV